MGVMELEELAERLEALGQDELNGLLNTLPGVREWLSGGDPQAIGSGAVLTTKEAGELVGVERQRLWRWEKQDKIRRVATTSHGPLFLRTDVEAQRDFADSIRRPGRGA
jgi:hypothetical protein